MFQYFVATDLSAKAQNYYFFIIFIQAEFISELSTLKHISVAMLRTFPFILEHEEVIMFTQ